jgi:hypothetical protein
MASLSFGRDPAIAFASAPRQRNHIAQSTLMRRVQNSRNRNRSRLDFMVHYQSKRDNDSNF